MSHLTVKYTLFLGILACKNLLLSAYLHMSRWCLKFHIWKLYQNFSEYSDSGWNRRLCMWRPMYVSDMSLWLVCYSRNRLYSVWSTYWCSRNSFYNLYRPCSLWGMHCVPGRSWASCMIHCEYWVSLMERYRLLNLSSSGNMMITDCRSVAAMW
jgi:hypothetical protein